MRCAWGGKCVIIYCRSRPARVTACYYDAAEACITSLPNTLFFCFSSKLLINSSRCLTHSEVCKVRTLVCLLTFGEHNRLGEVRSTIIHHKVMCMTTCRQHCVWSPSANQIAQHLSQLQIFQRVLWLLTEKHMQRSFGPCDLLWVVLMGNKSQSE